MFLLPVTGRLRVVTNLMKMRYCNIISIEQKTKLSLIKFKLQITITK